MVGKLDEPFQIPVPEAGQLISISADPKSGEFGSWDFVYDNHPASDKYDFVFSTGVNFAVFRFILPEAQGGKDWRFKQDLATVTQPLFDMVDSANRILLHLIEVSPKSVTLAMQMFEDSPFNEIGFKVGAWDFGTQALQYSQSQDPRIRGQRGGDPEIKLKQEDLAREKAAMEN